jgi:hypothetical protein
MSARGLDLELVFVRGASTAVQALLANQIHFIFSVAMGDRQNENSGLTQRRLVEYSRYRTAEYEKGR